MFRGAIIVELEISESDSVQTYFSLTSDRAACGKNFYSRS